MKPNLSVFLAIVTLAGCVYVGVTPAGERVNLVLDPNPPPLPASCELLKGTNRIPAGGWTTSPTDARSEAAIRNQAAEMGADTVVASALGANGWYLKYYRCKTPTSR